MLCYFPLCSKVISDMWTSIVSVVDSLPTEVTAEHRVVFPELCGRSLSVTYAVCMSTPTSSFIPNPIALHLSIGLFSTSVFLFLFGKEDPPMPFYWLPQFSSVQALSRVWLFATPWTATCQASLSITNAQSLLKLRPIASVAPPTISSPSPPTFNLSQHQGLL